MNDSTGAAHVLIAGAGPVGLTLAAELARHGVPSRIIDQSAGPVAASRAIAIHARTLEVFADMGIAEEVIKAGHPVHGASVYANGKRIIHFAFDELDSPFPFVIDLPQSETERILTRHLEHLGIEVERRTTLGGFNQDDRGVNVFLCRDDGSAETARASYVVGCDGANSTVRHTLGVQFDSESAGDSFLLADVPIEWDQPDDEWTIWLHEDGMLSVFPLPGGIYRVIADGTASEPTRGELLRLWKQRAPVAATPGEPQWLWSFRVNYRKANQYRQGRVFIAGDAAHVQSPAGGQGMNTGIQDAYNLAWKLALVIAGKSPDSLLDTYSAEREPVARGVLELTSRMTSLATLRHPLSQRLRDRLGSMLAQFEIIEQRLVNRLGETSVNYRNSSIADQDGHWYSASPMPGDRAPALLDILCGTRFKVLFFAGEQPGQEVIEQAAVIDRYMRDGYGDEIDSWLIMRDPFGWNGRLLPDVSGVFHHRYGAGLPCLYVVRPDNYIGFRSLGLEPLPLLSYLGKIFEAEPKAASC